MIHAHLADNSPLRNVFPSGHIPLTPIYPVKGRAGEGLTAPVEEFYMLDLSKCTDLEKIDMAKLMAELGGQGALDECMKDISGSKEIPVRTKNITGITFSLRQVT